ncbi:diacylglycerol kinase family protein [Mesonia sp. HuA40]|uniref:diacylglycerol/lipid kinase family protein n=1 Tax=Mesonia sp. HuA40 TaxID=2602761 RepID=UPI0011CC2F34|nr:diacylglycerol kinase family protein [Mesonia sp. HuA40]TXK70227.1 diacylglycerol kinase [Mesonia sp. HuA40]
MAILLILNPISGDINKSYFLKVLKNKLGKKVKTLNIFKTTGKNDLEHLKRHFQDHTYKKVLVAGGDGTVKLAAECLMNTSIPIGIIPLGSANGLATDLELPTSINSSIDIALGENARKIDAMFLNENLGLHISDLGINASLIKTYEQSSVRGKLGYIFAGIPTLLNNKNPQNFSIETNDQKLTRRGIMLGIANSRRYGTGALVNPEGIIDDGYFELLIFKELNVKEIIKTLRGEKSHNSSFLEIISCQQAKIYCETPIDFQIDGEYLGEVSSVEIKIKQKALNIMI